MFTSKLCATSRISLPPPRRARLAALRQAELAAMPATMTQRKIEIPFANGQSDGQREIYPSSTGELTITDLASKQSRVFFKTKAGDALATEGAIASRDLSRVVLLLHRGASYIYALIKTDGTGYREIAGEPATGWCRPDWSWDNRYVFGCTGKGSGPYELVRISVADGEVRKVRMVEGSETGPARIIWHRPSPGGRFLAFNGRNNTPAYYDKIFIMPSVGGSEPQLVADRARLIDWTRDGRYLIIAREISGSPALCLLPVKDGRAEGDPVFVRYGPFMNGSVNPDGGLVYYSALPAGIYATWIGNLDSAGRLVEWKTLELGGGRAPTVVVVRWSPDSSQTSTRCGSQAHRLTCCVCTIGPRVRTGSFTGASNQ